MKMKKLLAAGVAFVVMSGCASPTVVQSVKPGDQGLSCAQLQNEFSDANRFKKEADSEKGVTGGNVARLLFWPAIVGTHMNANEAIAAAENRKVHLHNLMSQKNCPVPTSSMVE
jgi:opacity protein-like surface antigen